MTLAIERVQTKAQLKQFIKMPWSVYQNNHYWVPWLFFERLEFFDKRKNAFFEHAEADYFIARRDGQPVGTIAAILNHRHNEFHEENVAHFGVFECLNDPEAAQALFDKACEWARLRGTDKILGPFNLSTNDECGLLIDGFDQPPVILMTYNPPYYVDLVEQAGFSKAMDLLAWDRNLVHMVSPGGMPDKLIRIVGKVKERYGLTVRPINMDDWDDELERVKQIYNNAWQRNWGFVPMTDGEFDHLAAGLKPIIDPNIAFMVEKEGQAVGFSLSLPDVNQVLHKIQPGPSTLSSYLAVARMLLAKGRVDRLRVIVLGVLEQYRSRGVDALLYYETAQAGVANGYHWAEASWVLETNDAMNRIIEAVGANIYKRYRIYEKEL